MSSTENKKSTRRAASARTRPAKTKAREAKNPDSRPDALVASADKLLPSEVGMRVIRDRIELTAAYIESLKLAQKPEPGSTLLFVAREIVVNAPGPLFSGVYFGDYNLSSSPTGSI